MDWAERLLHISPDGGSGYFELLIYCVLALVLALMTAHLARVKHSTQRSVSDFASRRE
jgi:hypothetical protein